MGPWKAYREALDQPVELFLVEEDVGSERNLADAYPQVVDKIGAIMRREHIDHPWYWNPNETREDFVHRQSLARDLGQLQGARQGNSQR